MGLLTSIPQNVLTSLISYFSSRFQPKLNTANTATGVNSVTINAINGVARFTEACAFAPNWTDYIIYNNLVTSSTLISVWVQSTAGISITLFLSANAGVGQIVVSINDGGSGSPAPPIVMFEILN